MSPGVLPTQIVLVMVAVPALLLFTPLPELVTTVQLVSVSVLPLPVFARPPPPVAVLPVTVQLVTVIVPSELYRPPPLPSAELPVMVQPASETWPPAWYTPPPLGLAGEPLDPRAEVPLTVQLVNVAASNWVKTPPPWAEVLPVTRQFVRVSVPARLHRPPPD